MPAMCTRRVAAVGQGRLRNRLETRPHRARRIGRIRLPDFTNACHHTTGDEIAVVDFRKLSRQSEIGFRLVLALGALAVATNGLPCDPLLLPEPYAGAAEAVATLVLALAAGRRRWR